MENGSILHTDRVEFQSLLSVVFLFRKRLSFHSFFFSRPCLLAFPTFSPHSLIERFHPNLRRELDLRDDAGTGRRRQSLVIRTRGIMVVGSRMTWGRTLGYPPLLVPLQRSFAHTGLSVHKCLFRPLLLVSVPHILIASFSASKRS